MTDCVLVADRGVAAVRVLRALQAHQVKAVSVHTAADHGALHSSVADESVLLGETAASYADVRKLLEAALAARADAVHPGTATVPGLERAVRDAGLGWYGDSLQVPVLLKTREGAVEAEVGDVPVTVPAVAPRAVEVVTGLDLTCAGLTGEATGVAREGVALSVDVVAEHLAPVVRWTPPSAPDVWVDAGVEAGDTPTEPLLAVLTTWGPDRETAYRLAREAWDGWVIEGPVVPRPTALEGGAP